MPHKAVSNEAETKNQLQRKFNQDEPYAVVVSDLTYVRVAGKWNYVCLFVDLFNREIVGYSCGANKDANLVYRAVASLSVRLDRIKMFHTDRGSEFDNHLISEALDTSRSIARSARKVVLTISSSRSDIQNFQDGVR